ncbi:MAG TPA: ABC transporter ATP-binding protein [Acidimicrobiia bacterium]|nr:ABC transporter ATP-binding protein [Acidimicrobiia bacterium]
MAVMTLAGVEVRRGADTVLDDVSLEVERGERIGLVGRSGSGKTSLLRVMAGLDSPASGDVLVAGRPMAGTRREVTMVFQEDAVYDHLDVGENLEFPFRVTSRAGGRHIDDTADRFLIRALLGRAATELSAGQRHVVSAARALVRPEVEVVLLDEPMVGTDPHRRRLLVEALAGDSTLTLVISTNDPADVLRWSTRAVVLADGGIAQTGVPVDVYRRPVSLEVAEVMGELNRLPAGLHRNGEWWLELAGSRIKIPDPPRNLVPGERVVLGIRPEALAPADETVPFARRLRATVGRTEVVGPTRRIYFGIGSVAGTGFVAEVDSRHRLQVGDRVDWEIRSKDMLLFDAPTGRRL